MLCCLVINWDVTESYLAGIQGYLLHEKGAVALANRFALRPQGYQQRAELAFSLL